MGRKGREQNLKDSLSLALLLRAYAEERVIQRHSTPRIFGTLVVKFLACLPILGFLNIYKMVLLPIFNGFLT